MSSTSSSTTSRKGCRASPRQSDSAQPAPSGCSSPPRWPGGEGPNWAEVTEGNALAWERNRYEWNAGAGEVTVTAVESDTWAPGSQWRYRLLSTATGGTEVQVTVVRTGRGPRGMLIGALISGFGRRILRSDMEKMLARMR